MKWTRFDGIKWISASGEKFYVCDMSTEHLLNTLRMLIMRPDIVLNMVIHDFEHICEDNPCTNFNQKELKTFVIESTDIITSYSFKELITQTLNSPLVLAMREELIHRGVNVDKYINNIQVYLTGEINHD